MIAQYISIDEQKKDIQGYKPAEAAKYHKESAKKADKLFDQALKKDPSPSVILLCGGSASGKTEFCSEYLNDEHAIIYDGTLSTPEGAEIKLRNIRKAGKKAIVIAVLPDDFKRAFTAFLHRDRQFEDRHFYRTHMGARKTLLWIAEHAPNIEMRLFESTYKKKATLSFNALEYKTHDELIGYLKSIQYTENEIISVVTAL